MSLESKVMPSVAAVVSFIRENVATDLSNFYNKSEDLKGAVTTEQLQTICRVVEESIQSNFLRSSNQIVSLLNSID